MLRMTSLAGFGASGSRASAIPPPSDPDFASVVLLAGFDGADGATAFSDESPAAHGAFTFVGQSQLDTAQKKFGSASLQLDGVNDRITLPDHADWTFDGAFTIEAWIKPTVDGAGTLRTIMSQWTSTGDQISWLVRIDGGENIQFFHSLDGTTAPKLQGDSPTISTSVFTHVAVTRDAGDTIRLYVGGSLRAGPSVVIGSLFASTGIMRIGAIEGSGLFNGWIDDVRITKGVARYVVNFTPPTAPFPRQ